MLVREFSGKPFPLKPCTITISALRPHMCNQEIERGERGCVWLVSTVQYVLNNRLMRYEHECKIFQMHTSLCIGYLSYVTLPFFPSSIVLIKVTAGVH
jgi:hypothetical protein